MFDLYLRPVSIGNLCFSPDERCIVFSTLEYNDHRDRVGRVWQYDREKDELVALTEPGDDFGFSFWDNDGLLLAEDAEQDGRLGTMVRYYSLERKCREDRFFLPIPGLSVEKLEKNLYLLSGSCPLENPLPAPASAYQHSEVITRTPYRMDGAGDVQGLRTHLWLYRPEWDAPRDFFPKEFQCNATFFQRENGLLYYAGESYDRISTGSNTLFCLDTKTLQVCEIGTIPQEIALLTAVERQIFALAYDRRGNGMLYRYTPSEPTRGLICEHELEGDFGWCLDTDIALLGGGGFYGHEGTLWMIYSDPSGARICTYQSGQIQAISPVGYQVRSFTISPHGSIFAVCLHGYWALELFELKNGCWVQRSHFQPELTHAQLPVELPYQNRCGHDMLGWVIPPIDYVPGRSYPGFLMIHEGPQGRYEAIYHSDMQFLSQLGYFVFFTNPRGGSCVSRAFADLEDRMGTIDYEDLMDFTDAVLNAFPDLNRNRMAVGGISYGGYMTNWIIGHTTRFHTAVSMSSISNWLSLYGTMDLPYCVEYGSVSGKPWTNFAGYWRASPLKNAHKVQTPTLFIQGESDYRCPLSQAQQMFCALQQNGIQSRLIQYPNASHNFGYYGTSEQRESRYQEIARWLKETNS